MNDQERDRLIDSTLYMLSMILGYELYNHPYSGMTKIPNYFNNDEIRSKFRNKITNEFYTEMGKYFIGKYVFFKNSKIEGYFPIVGFNEKLIVEFNGSRFGLSYDGRKIVDSI